MKNLIRLALLSFVLTCTNVHAQQRVEPLVNLEKIQIRTGSGKQLTEPEVRASIIRAAESQQWTYSDAGSGKLTATLTTGGKHSISVLIPFNTSNFSVLYKDSINMNYEASKDTTQEFHGMYRPFDSGMKKTSAGPQPVIHKSYNVWTKNLLDRIQYEFKQQ